MSSQRKKSTKKVKKTTAKHPPERKATAPRPDEMTPDVLEFITAIDDYKRQEGRPFPSWTEILEIVKGLGYDKSSAE